MGAEIKMPVAKAASALSLATAAKVDAADALAKAATANASFETWYWVNSIPWGNVASIVAFAYTSLLICEWFWKKLWRPAFERWGWIKPRLGPRIITLDEYRQMSETQRADLS